MPSMSMECDLIMAATFGLLLYGFEHFGGQGNSGHEQVAEGRRGRGGENLLLYIQCT